MQARLSRIIAIALLSAATGTFFPIAAQQLQQRPAAPQAAPSLAPVLVQSGVPAQPVLPSGTSLQVEITRHYPMKAGETLEGRLMHPIYVDGKLAVPQNTLLHGTVVALQPDRKMRWEGRVRGDFTPFHTAQVRFNELEFASGAMPIAAAAAANGAPVLHLTAPGVKPRQSLFAREWAQAKSRVRDQLAFFTAPGFGDRARQLLYHQLPYHSEQIPAHTAWSFELTEPVTLPQSQVAVSDPPPAIVNGSNPETWSVHAILEHDLSSSTAKSGDPVQALVVEPVYDKDRKLVVPEGATLIGKVSAAKAARSLGRNGKLRFTFQQVQFPEGFQRAVQGSLAGAATEKAQDLSLDAEGTITPRSQASAIAPLLLTMLAGHALDSDGNMTLQTGVASNGFGFVGRIVGTVAGSRNLAAGIGFYAAGLSVYDNFLHSGRDVVFPKDTRIEIDTTPLRAPVLKPEGQ
ncbi:MAG: hypothetical protein KGJ51_00330 [Acidobacteriota bacterium]|nr:hypothetical protein [Acidobacteriota bacterium]